MILPIRSRCFDEMPVGKVDVAGGCAVPPLPEQLAYQWQILARHDGLTCGGVAKVMQAQPATLRIREVSALMSDT